MNTIRSSIRNFAGLSLLAFAVAAPQCGHAQDMVSRAELEKLQQQAHDARLKAEAALKDAIAAENAVNAALQRSVPGSPPDQPLPAQPAHVLARIDCVATDRPQQSRCTGVEAKRDLVAYAAAPSANYSESPEAELVRHVNSKIHSASSSAPAGDKKDKDPIKRISFAKIDQPFASRFTANKGDEALELQYSWPLSRRRFVSPPGDPTETVAAPTSLTFDFSAAFDADDKKIGLLRKDGTFNDNQISAKVTYSKQYYPAVPLRGSQKTTSESRGKAFANGIIAQCKAAMAAAPDSFGYVGKKPTACEGDSLLEWAFNPDQANFGENVADYNSAFWEPAAGALPDHGWGLTTAVGTQVFKHIVPANFAPGIVVDPSLPTLLSTLETASDKTPNLGQLKDRKWAFELGGFAFRHFPGSLLIFDGLTVRQGATVARRWEVKKAFSGKEFCRIKLATIGECKTFNIAPADDYVAFEPSLNLRTIVDVGDKWGLGKKYLPKIGLSPTLTFSTHSDRYRVVVPAYIAVDKDGNLNGGIQYSRQWGDPDKSKNIGIWSVFVATKFSMDGSK